MAASSLHPDAFDRAAPERSRTAEILRSETVGGALLVLATVVALVWANSPWGDSYEQMREFHLGPASLHLTVTQWAGDGLLAIFFFVAGLELKREFVAGDLREPRKALLPVAAAVGGMVLPALLFLLINARAGPDALSGWAIPIATDIAFALAVLAVVSTALPAALRTFLLTLAVVDDLLAIIVIAVFYTRDLHSLPLLLALLPLAAFTVAVQRRVHASWLLLPLALLTWALVHASGIHATVAGVLLGFAVPVMRSAARGGPAAGPGPAERMEHRWRPVSSGVAVPLFALTSAGVVIGGLSGLRSTFSDTVAIGVVVGLVVGKSLGVLGASALVVRTTHARLAPGLAWADVVGLSLLAGIGFTVSLLIGELAYGEASERDAHVRIAVLTGSLLAGAAAAVVLRLRHRVHVGESADPTGR